MTLSAINATYPMGCMFGAKSRLLLSSMMLCMGILAINHAQAATVHLVQAGETIEDIATRYKVSKTALIDVNGLQAINVTNGQRLQLPVVGETHSLHKVTAAETLTSLSKKYNIDLNELARVNRMTPQSGLMIDSTLIIPAVKNMNNAESAKIEPIASVSIITEPTVMDQKITKTPTVQKTPTAPKIPSQKVSPKISVVKVEPAASTKANSAKALPTDKDKAVRSANLVSRADKTHVVKSGETLFAIADLYKVTLSSLAQVNDMKVTDTLHIGVSLVLPSPENKANPKKVVKREAVVAAPIRYHVKSGDTLTKVANKFKTDFMTIAKLSKIEHDSPLKIGQVLTVPNNGGITETVE